MSVVAVIVRCDHKGCENTTDFLSADIEGWLRKEVRVFHGVTIALDFCPEHVGKA